ncbi:MAG: MBL fold metallo-hydrolase [Firmicutes bacterium]|nr:MBL fold metallo-hydrolase [Bacillota bacterium]
MKLELGVKEIFEEVSILIKVTVLCENSVGTPTGLTGEWGLAMLVEVAGQRILFDTGESGKLLSNAAALRVDLRSVDTLVMSHGHYDHAGGMRDFLRYRGRLPVYAHPDFFNLRYSEERYIGVPYREEELASLGADFVFSREPIEIVPGVWFSGEVPRITDFEKGDRRLICLRNGNKVNDPIYDDVSLFCVTSEGLLIILGCAHAGVVNIIEHARQVTGLSKVYGVIGGTHLGAVSAVQQEATINYLRKLNLHFLAVNHCTGLSTIAQLAMIFGPQFHFAPAGTIFKLPCGNS